MRWAKPSDGFFRPAYPPIQTGSSGVRSTRAAPAFQTVGVVFGTAADAKVPEKRIQSRRHGAIFLMAGSF
jgi:hypothetical protein